MSFTSEMSFISEDQDRHRLPVAILSGFLGAGKTTLLNAVLRDPRLADTAVAINEFGEVPLDQHLIDHGADKTVVMANGCLCCNLAGDLESALMRVFSRRTSGELPAFARLIVEPSGLADPAPIAQGVLRNPILSRVLRLDTILTVVDAFFGQRQLDAYPEMRAQIALADQILLTKTDLAEPGAVAALEMKLRALNPTAKMRSVLNGKVDPDDIFARQFLDTLHAPSSIAEWVASHEPQRADHTHMAHAHDAEIGALSIVCDEPLDFPRFETWLRRIRIDFADDLLRVKGILDHRGAPLVLQGVHHVLHPPVALAKWPSEDHRSRLVFITRGRGDEIAARWHAAKADLLATPANLDLADARH